MRKEVPHEFSHYLQGHVVDAIDYSTRNIEDRYRGLTYIVLGFIFGGIFPFFGLLFLIPLFAFFETGQSSITVNGQPQIFETVWTPALFSLTGSGIFFLVGIPGMILIFFGIKTLLKKGFWFAITKDSLISYDSKKFRETPWNTLNDNIETRHTGGKDTIILSRKNHPVMIQAVDPATSKPVKNISLDALFSSKISLSGLQNGEYYLNLIRNYIK